MSARAPAGAGGRRASMAAFEPSDTLKSRTFLGLILAQFLAAFNDQAIHAASMFYAIHHNVLSEAQAISLMPILFYAPWAIFCTLAGYLADRFSKRTSLVAWKVVEVGITLVALGGFWLGSSLHYDRLGPWVVLSTVFLMGTHSAFFVPAKYGVMPEILSPQLLSKGNGVLESTSFLAVILGTVSGGVLFSVFGSGLGISFPLLPREFRHQEYWIGIMLVALAVVGALASLLIRPVPAANPNRPFPVNLVSPLADNLRTLRRSRPLALAVLGIAFFTFMVAFMRATMYLHGQSHHWREFETSLVVATVALGVGLGSPLAGVFSGGKVELGLVPLGSLGMAAAALVAAFTIFRLPGLIVSLVLLGFFSGFYIVPLYTLLQHRAPKTSKGELVATSNFVNVTGAIVASLLFLGLVGAAKAVGIARSVPQEDVAEARGELWEVRWRMGRPVALEVREDRDGPALFRVSRSRQAGGPVIQIDEDLREGARVAVSRYTLRGVTHYEVRPEGAPLRDAYDEALVPRFLFLGAAAMTLAILLVLCRQLPDFFVRSLLWVRSHGRYRLRSVGVNHLPTDGPAILATNCEGFQACMDVISATDRFTRFVLLESAADPEPRPLLRFLAQNTGLVALRPERTTAAERQGARERAVAALRDAELLGVTAASDEHPAEAEALLGELRARSAVPILPVFWGALDPANGPGAPLVRRVRVVFGPPVGPGTPVAEIVREIRRLGAWIEEAERKGATPATAMIPAAAAASPTAPAADRPPRP